MIYQNLIAMGIFLFLQLLLKTTKKCDLSFLKAIFKGLPLPFIKLRIVSNDYRSLCAKYFSPGAISVVIFNFFAKLIQRNFEKIELNIDY